MTQPSRCRIDPVEASMHGIKAILGGDDDGGALNRDTTTQDQFRLFETCHAGSDLKREVQRQIALAKTAHGGDQGGDSEWDRSLAEPFDRSCLANIAIRGPGHEVERRHRRLVLDVVIRIWDRPLPPST